ncbi:AMP-binding protein [Streptomyces sp. NPDC004647]|uniref:AMP-binding protein n=1 Tax=Streptomyces sp. NPDC004647 TaxID=3154671 RepID=UPI0033A8E2E5
MTGKSRNPHTALYSRFLRGLSLSPDRPAIRLGAEVITYRRAHELALRWAGSLLAHRPVGEQAGPPVVGVLAGKGLQSYVGILAALYAGATVVPLNPDFPAARNQRMLRISGAQVLLADGQGLAGTQDLFAEGGVPLPVVAPDADGRLEDGAEPLTEPCPVTCSDTAYMLFTSGSTGVPKGVPISHGNTHHYFELINQQYDFGPDDIFTQTFDLNFDCGIFDLFCAWGAGASIAYVPPQAYRDMPGFLAERGVTVWFSTPSAISLLRRMGGLTPGALPTLRWSFFAGEALRCQDAADWQTAAPASALANIYGPTELTVTITGHLWHSESSPARSVNGLVPIGRVHEGHDHLLVDEADRPVADEGELLVTGPQMTHGYLDPADNEGRFVERDGRIWYRTGDRVRRLDDGELVYLGRLDAQVQVQGWRVELAEIEHALRGQDGVDDAVTVPHRPEGGSTELVVFYTGAKVSPMLLSRALREVLPHGMLPRRYEHLRELPLNSNRKVDRSALARRAAELMAPAAVR